MNAHDLLCLAVLWRTNSPNLGCVSTHEAMTEAGLAYMLGHYSGLPRRYKRVRAAWRNRIADILEQKAKETK